MKQDKIFVTLLITAAIVLLVDLAYDVFFVHQLIINYLGKAFMYEGIWWVSLVVIILNGIQLCFVGIAVRKIRYSRK